MNEQTAKPAKEASPFYDLCQRANCILGVEEDALPTGLGQHQPIIQEKKEEKENAGNNVVQVCAGDDPNPIDNASQSRSFAPLRVSGDAKSRRQFNVKCAPRSQRDLATKPGGRTN